MIKDMPKLDKPREKAIRYGVKSLSDSELLAIIIRTGTKNESAIKIAQDIILLSNGISNFHNLSLERLSLIKGIGMVKAITILSALELGKRSLYNSKDNIKITNALDVYKNFKYHIVNESQELFFILFLNTQKKLLNYKIIYKGTKNGINIDSQEIFKEAYIHNASSIIIVHNHPDGLCFPSKEDYNATYKLIKISKIMNIPLLDHIILTNNNYYSFYENGDLNEK